jgi:predicted RNA-binding protein YlqC (UPF0109 family)
MLCDRIGRRIVERRLLLARPAARKGDTSRTEDGKDVDTISQMRELVLLMARSLVDDPGSVAVTPAISEGGTSFYLVVAAGDEGKVIGKQGRTARSFRTILSAAGTKCRRRFVLDIADNRRS